MGKAKAKKEDSKKGGAPAFAVSSTLKWAVIDAPGVKQPDWSAQEPEDTKKPAKEGQQGRRAKASSGPKIEGSKIGGDSFVERTKDPEWLKTRTSVYESVKERRAAEWAKKTPVPIKVTMPDGKVLEADKDGKPFQSYETTPYDVAATISQGLADSATVARVTYAKYADDYDPLEDGMEGEDTLADAMADGGVEQDSASGLTYLWDMMRPLVGEVAKLELLKFNDDRDAKTVFWHSSAHMMGEALEHLYGCKLTIGPPLAGGFYYDSYMGDDALRETDCKLRCRVGTKG